MVSIKKAIIKTNHKMILMKKRKMMIMTVIIWTINVVKTN